MENDIIQEWYAKKIDKTVREFDEYDLHITKVIGNWGEERETILKIDKK